jgi:hypothetical protein
MITGISEGRGAVAPLAAVVLQNLDPRCATLIRSRPDTL